MLIDDHKQYDGNKFAPKIDESHSGFTMVPSLSHLPVVCSVVLRSQVWQTFEFERNSQGGKVKKRDNEGQCLHVAFTLPLLSVNQSINLIYKAPFMLKAAQISAFKGNKLKR